MTAPVIAAFDFDKTLTYCDTLIPFLAHCLGKPQAFYCLAQSFPNALAFASGLQSRQKLKEAVLMRAFRKWSMCELSAKGEQFAYEKIDSLLNPAAMLRLRWHQAQHHRCILISGALSIYLKPWAKKAGFDHLLCSELAEPGPHTPLGKLQGANCWGKEKVHRLQALLGEKHYTLYAYGDSQGDKELLALADHSFYRCFE